VLHDIGEADKVQFLVMEYLEGETLAQRLRSVSLSWTASPGPSRSSGRGSPRRTLKSRPTVAGWRTNRPDRAKANSTCGRFQRSMVMRVRTHAPRRARRPRPRHERSSGDRGRRNGIGCLSCRHFA
jgi:hypothetical protein